MIGDSLNSPFGQPLFLALAAIVIALGIFVSAACVSLLAHHVVSARRRRLRASLVARATRLLAPAIVTAGGLTECVEHARRRLGDGAVAEVLRRARVEIKGPCAMELTSELARIGEVERLSREARSRWLWRRRAAVRGLGECGGMVAREALLRAANDLEPDVRRAARDGLLNDGLPESTEVAIRSFLDDLPRNFGWRREFYSRLATRSPAALLDLTTSGRLTTHDEKIALEALGDIHEQRALEHARGRLRSADPEMRSTATRVLGKLRDAESAPAIAALLDDPAWYVRAAAARAFEHLPATDEHLSALGDRLTDPAWWVRANAARTLAHKDQAGADVLLRTMEGTDRFARQTAITAISRIEISPAVRARLAEMLRRLESDPQTRNMAALVQAAPGGPK